MFHLIADKMDTHHLIILWLIGVVLIAIGWYLPGAMIFLWLGVLTLIFGAALAFRRPNEG